MPQPGNKWQQLPLNNRTECATLPRDEGTWLPKTVAETLSECYRSVKFSFIILLSPPLKAGMSKGAIVKESTALLTGQYSQPKL